MGEDFDFWGPLQEGEEEGKRPTLVAPRQHQSLPPHCPFTMMPLQQTMQSGFISVANSNSARVVSMESMLHTKRTMPAIESYTKQSTPYVSLRGIVTTNT